MVKNISNYISETFYENKLDNNNEKYNMDSEKIYHVINIKNNISFFDLNYSLERKEYSSFSNQSEIYFCNLLIII